MVAERKCDVNKGGSQVRWWWLSLRRCVEAALSEGRAASASVAQGGTCCAESRLYSFGKSSHYRFAWEGVGMPTSLHNSGDTGR